MAQSNSIAQINLGVLIASLAGTVLLVYFAIIEGIWADLQSNLTMQLTCLLGLCVGLVLMSAINLGSNLDPIKPVDPARVPSPPAKVEPSPPIEQQRVEPQPVELPIQPPEKVEPKSIPVKSEARSLPAREEKPPVAVVLNPVSTIKSKTEFITQVIKLGQLAKEAEELAENEEDLSKKEKTQLSLRRYDFKKLYANIKGSKYEAF